MHDTHTHTHTHTHSWAYLSFKSFRTTARDSSETTQQVMSAFPQKTTAEGHTTFGNVYLKIPFTKADPWAQMCLRVCVSASLRSELYYVCVCVCVCVITTPGELLCHGDTRLLTRKQSPFFKKYIYNNSPDVLETPRSILQTHYI